MEAAVRGVLIASIYLPNGNPQPGPKFTYKLAWFERLMTHASNLIAADVPAVLAGDYNVVPTPEDIYPTRSLDKNALVQPASRDAFQRLLRQGWSDALRIVHPSGPLWTFWDYKFERWQADKGMRLDHLLLSPKLEPLLFLLSANLPDMGGAINILLVARCAENTAEITEQVKRHLDTPSSCCFERTSRRDI